MLLGTVIATVIVLVGAFPEAIRIGFVAGIITAAVVTADERHQPGGGWWMLLGAGAVLSGVGAGLAVMAQETETAGGVFALVGGTLVVIGAAVGFPLRER